MAKNLERMKTLLLNHKPVVIAGAVALLVLLFVYFKGRRDGSEPGFFTKLFSPEPDPNAAQKIYIPSPGQGGNTWSPNQVTNAIYQAIEDHGVLSPNGTEINSAFATFNALTHNQKVAVINDWEQRYKGTDKAGWFTGDYGSLFETISEWTGNFQPQVEIAWTWMNTNQID